MQDGNFTERDLVSFGEYLFSEKRESSVLDKAALKIPTGLLMKTKKDMYMTPIYKIGYTKIKRTPNKNNFANFEA